MKSVAKLANDFERKMTSNFFDFLVTIFMHSFLSAFKLKNVNQIRGKAAM